MPCSSERKGVVGGLGQKLFELTKLDKDDDFVGVSGLSGVQSCISDESLESGVNAGTEAGDRTQLCVADIDEELWMFNAPEFWNEEELQL